MADKSVSELIAAQSVTPTDLFVLEQNGTAKKLTGQILENWLVSFADGHGGIQSIVKKSTSGLVDTYRITLADTTTFDFMVTNGRSVDYITKTSTSGLVDTYQISYNDGTSSTFTVNNGEKGDKGDNAYIWIKFASQQPTASSNSFGDVPDDWIGIYFGSQEEAPTDWQQYIWYKIKGEKGDTGDPATLVSATVTYQVGETGTIIPSGAWTESIPVVAQGKYLWTKIVQQFNTGSPITSYTVSRMGLDGLGSVVSVAGVSPDESGNVPLTADDIRALSISGGFMEGPINMNGQTLSGLNVPAQSDHASNKGYVDQQTKLAVHRNLLDNSDFRNPVNQRWLTSYNVSGYTIDRWRTWADGTVNIVDGGITNTVNLYQYLEPGTIDDSKIYTFAVGYADDSITMVSGKFADGPGNDLIGLITDPDNGLDRVAINSSDKTAQWAALYEGEYTADNLPKYQPKGYAVELAECRRYYQRVGQLISTGAAAVGYCYSDKSVRFVTSISPMRKENPTATLASTDSMPMVICNGSTIARGALTFMAYTYKNGQHLALVVTVEGGTQLATAVLITNNACYFELSADL